jgi:hypothetical protein
VQRAERGPVIDRQHGGAFGTDSPRRKARKRGAAHGDPLVVSRSSCAAVAHEVQPPARTFSGRVGWTETAEMLRGDGSSRWTARCSLPLWVHRAPHRVQNAGRCGLTTMTTRDDSQTGHLGMAASPIALPDSWGVRDEWLRARHRPVAARTTDRLVYAGSVAVVPEHSLSPAHFLDVLGHMHRDADDRAGSPASESRSP